MANPITFTGLGSGIDSASIVDALVQAERKQNIVPYEKFKSQWTDKVSSLQTLNTKLATLHSTVKSLDSLQEFLVKSTSSSSTTVATATADSSAINDSYSIEVNQLAQAEKEIHAGFPDADTTAIHNNTTFDGEFSYTYDGTTRTVFVDAGTTLSELVDLINNDAQNPGITASILNDGSGSATAYHLVLSGDSTGADYSIDSIFHTLDNMSGTGVAGGDFSASQTAQNSQIKVDGYPAGANYIERSSNTISDVVSGLTLTLSGTGTTAITSNVDTESVKTKLSDFVDAFNDVRTFIKEQTNFDSDTNESGVLLGNYAVDIIKNKLNDIVSTKPPGFRSDYDYYTTLAQIGIKTDASTGSETQGQLYIDTAELDAALSNDAQAVAELFAINTTGRSIDSNLIFESALPSITEAGTYEIQFNASDPDASLMRQQGTETWHAVSWDATTQTITGSSGYPEAGLTVRISDTASDYSGEVDVKTGIAGDLKSELDFLTDPFDGPIAVLEENYDLIMDNVDEKIELEEKRINLFEQRMIARYARLEQVLTELNSQSQYLNSRLSQLQS